MVNVYLAGVKHAREQYGLSPIDRFTQGLSEEPAPKRTAPPARNMDRPVVWGESTSPGEYGLATGHGTGLGEYGGV